MVRFSSKAHLTFTVATRTVLNSRPFPSLEFRRRIAASRAVEALSSGLEGEDLGSPVAVPVSAHVEASVGGSVTVSGTADLNLHVGLAEFRAQRLTAGHRLQEFDTKTYGGKDAKKARPKPIDRDRNSGKIRVH